MPHYLVYLSHDDVRRATTILGGTAGIDHVEGFEFRVEFEAARRILHGAEMIGDATLTRALRAAFVRA